MNKIKLIIFDLDDTLINTYENMYLRTRFSGIQTLNKKISRKQFDVYYGIPGFNQNMKQLFNIEEIQPFLDCFDDALNKYKYELIIDTSKLIELKNKDIRLGIISNSLKAKNEKKLLTENLKSYFDFIYSFEDLEKPKPDVKITEKIIQNLKIESKEIIIVGDSKIDKEFADNAKIKFIPVNTGKDKWKNIEFYESVNDFLNTLL